MVKINPTTISKTVARNCGATSSFQHVVKYTSRQLRKLWREIMVPCQHVLRQLLPRQHVSRQQSCDNICHVSNLEITTRMSSQTVKKFATITMLSQQSSETRDNYKKAHMGSNYTHSPPTQASFVW